MALCARRAHAAAVSRFFPRRSAIRGICLLTAAILDGCGGGPPQPDWKLEARASLEAYQRHLLRGEGRAAEVEWRRALLALSATGQPVEVARANLVRCGLAAASADVTACPGPLQDEAELTAAEGAYARLVTGRLAPGEARALPERYRAVAQAPDPAMRVRALSSMGDPLSRLVAAGALLRAGLLPRQGVDLAVDTASAEGMRRPLAAWLGLQARAADEAGDPVAAARARRRLDLVAPAR